MWTTTEPHTFARRVKFWTIRLWSCRSSSAICLAYVCRAVFQPHVDQAGELMGRGRDRLRRPQPGLHPAEEGPQRALMPMQAGRGPPPRRRRSGSTGLRAPRSHLASRDLMVGAAPEPGRDVLHGRPSPQIEPDLTAAGQGRGLVDARNGGEVDPRHPRPRASHVDTRSVACPLPRPPYRRSRLTGPALSACRTVRFALAVTRADLLVIQVIEPTFRMSLVIFTTLGRHQAT
jgi:hypothetical protein